MAQLFTLQWTCYCQHLLNLVVLYKVLHYQCLWGVSIKTNIKFSHSDQLIFSDNGLLCCVCVCVCVYYWMCYKISNDMKIYIPDATHTFNTSSFEPTPTENLTFKAHALTEVHGAAVVNGHSNESELWVLYVLSLRLLSRNHVLSLTQYSVIAGVAFCYNCAMRYYV